MATPIVTATPRLTPEHALTELFGISCALDGVKSILRTMINDTAGDHGEIHEPLFAMAELLDYLTTRLDAAHNALQAAQDRTA